ncbi:MAG: Rieske (2Fe-2S) protein [Myxococcaceae bacterium]|nr:Rieske (2Fe-2S) protein [Myxococcaceae bacterium]
MTAVRVLDSEALAEGARAVVEARGRSLAVVRLRGSVFAIDNICPHRGGELGLGDLQGHHLYCPQHAWCFDVRTGEGFFPQGVNVARFDVAERDGGIWVELP